VLARRAIGLHASDAVRLTLCHEGGSTATLESFQSRPRMRWPTLRHFSKCATVIGLRFDLNPWALPLRSIWSRRSMRPSRTSPEGQPEKGRRIKAWVREIAGLPEEGLSPLLNFRAKSTPGVPPPTVAVAGGRAGTSLFRRLEM